MLAETHERRKTAAHQLSLAQAHAKNCTNTNVRCFLSLEACSGMQMKWLESLHLISALVAASCKVVFERLLKQDQDCESLAWE